MDIKEYMEMTGMSIRDFAAFCDISVPSCFRYLHGSIPTERIAKRIQKKTKKVITVEELLNPKKTSGTTNSKNRRKPSSLGSTNILKKKNLRQKGSRKKVDRLETEK